MFANLMNKVEFGKQALGLVVPTSGEELKQEGLMMAGGAVLGGPAGAGLGVALNRLVKAGSISNRARKFLMDMAPKNLGDVPEEILEKALRGSTQELGALERIGSAGRAGVATSKEVKQAVRSFDNLEFRMASAADNPGNLMKLPKLFDNKVMQEGFAEGVRTQRQKRLRNLNVADRFNVDKIDESGNLLELIPAGKRSSLKP